MRDAGSEAGHTRTPRWRTCGLILLASFITGSASPAAAAGPPRLAVAATDWGLADAYRVATATQEKICLNGIWRISLVERPKYPEQPKLTRKERILAALKRPRHGGAAAGQPVPLFHDDLPWNDVRVPGRWFEGRSYDGLDHECMISGTVKRCQRWICNSIKWNGKPLADYAWAWHEREFQLPAAWKANESFLLFDSFKLEAWIFVNGKYLAYQQGRQASEIPLPADVAAGQNFRLSVLVGAEVNGVEKIFLGAEQVHEVKKSSLSRGISGDVWLLRHPVHEYIQRVFVLPSVRNKTLVLRLDIAAENPSGTLAGQIKPRGKSETAKAFDMDFAAAKKVAPGTWEFQVPWDNATCWSPENPFLYTLQVVWKSAGQVKDAPLPVQFGFREFWIRGRDFYLNGAPYRLRMTTALGDWSAPLAEALFREWKGLGFNSAEYLLEENLPRTAFEKADEMGYLLLPVLPAVNPYVDFWQEPAARQAWQKETTACLRALFNYACVTMWDGNHNLLGYPLDVHPAYLGTDYLPAPGVKQQAAAESEAFIKAMDPSRPMMHHAGGNHGAVSTSNFYLNFAPLQEKEDWLSRWAAEGVKPFVAIELGMPLDCSYFAGRMGFGSGKTYFSEPCMAEYCARVVGPKAYGLTPDAFIKTIVESVVRPGVLEGIDQYDAAAGWFYGPFRRARPADYLAAEAVLGDFVYAWRAWGVSGMNPWVTDTERWNNWKFTEGETAQYASMKTPGIKPIYVYSPHGETKTPLWDKYHRWLAPQLLFLAGPKDQFTDKLHACPGGRDLLKGVAFVNDTLQNATADVAVELADSRGAVLAARPFRIVNKPGEISVTDFRFLMPEVKQKTPFVLRLVRKEGGKDVLQDQFAVQRFPGPREPAVGRTVYLMDSKGLTAALLKEAAVPAITYQGQALGENDLLIIGRESLPAAVPFAAKLREAVPRGLNLIVMEQTKEQLEDHLGFRAVAARSRRVFLGPQRSSIFRGLDDEDMADWPGKSTLLEEYSRPVGDVYPDHVWHWGSRGIVASVVIEKPHRGGFVSLAHEGFDLAYAPLLGERLGRGRILYSQLDLSGRTQSGPVIRMVLHNLLAAMSGPPSPEDRPVLFGAGNVAPEILDLLGVRYQDKTDFATLPPNAIVVFGDHQPLSPRKAQILRNLGRTGAFEAPEPGSVLERNRTQVQSFLESGGTLILLAVRNPDQMAGQFGVKAGHFKMEGYRFPFREVGGLTLGLTDGDFYWKDTLPAALPVADFPLLASPVGRGQVIVCQINPLALAEKDMNQRRQRSRHKMARVLNTVLTHLSAPTVCSSLDFLPQSASRTGRTGSQGVGLPSKPSPLYEDSDSGPEKRHDPYKYRRW